MSRRDPQEPLRDDDHEQRQQVTRLSQAFPRWLIMWGAYSRQFWAYPRFDAPRGTIAHAADPGGLVAKMRAIELAASNRPRWQP